jgi:hypothetical protein
MVFQAGGPVNIRNYTVFGAVYPWLAISPAYVFIAPLPVRASYSDDKAGYRSGWAMP